MPCDTARQILYEQNRTRTLVSERETFKSSLLADRGKVAFFDPARGKPARVDRVDVLLEALFHNTGSILCSEAPKHQFRYDTTINDLKSHRDDFDTLVLSAGNFISPKFDMNELANEIEQSKATRIVMIGAGIHSQPNIEEINHSSISRRLFDIVAERSASIGVQGDITASVLEKLGIKNIDVIGCPTAYMIRKPFKRRDDSCNLKLAINTVWHGHYRDAIAELLAFGSSHDALFVEQANEAIMHYGNEKIPNKDVNFLTRFYSDGPNNAWALLDWLGRKATYYTDMPAWHLAMNEVDLVIGPRFHGAVAANHVGTRSLLLIFDTRTKELAEYFNLPHLRFEDFDASRSPEFYYESADPEFMLSSLEARSRQYQRFLLKNGLELAQEFHLADAPASEVAQGQAPGAPARDGMNRFFADLETAKVPYKVAWDEASRRQRPLRDSKVGDQVDRAEFVQSYKERAGLCPPVNRVPWRERQGVRSDYIHQSAPQQYDDRGQKEQWQRQIYVNARRIAEANQFKRIIDFGCGSGFKLVRYFDEFETIGIEIDPALSALRTEYPDRDWVDGTVIYPGLFRGDLVLCSDVIEHLFEPDLLLAALAASEARAFVLSTPALEVLSDRGLSNRLGPPANPTHVYEWTTAEFHALVSQYFTIVAHEIVSLGQATQMCIAIRKDAGLPPLTLPDLTCGL